MAVIAYWHMTHLCISSHPDLSNQRTHVSQSRSAVLLNLPVKHSTYMRYSVVVMSFEYQCDHKNINTDHGDWMHKGGRVQ